jgi:hypothetical protein
MKAPFAGEGIGDEMGVNKVTARQSLIILTMNLNRRYKLGHSHGICSRKQYQHFHKHVRYVDELTEESDYEIIIGASRGYRLGEDLILHLRISALIGGARGNRIWALLE